MIEGSVHAFEERTHVAPIVQFAERERRLVESAVSPTVVGRQPLQMRLHELLLPVLTRSAANRVCRWAAVGSIPKAVEARDKGCDRVRLSSKRFWPPLSKIDGVAGIEIDFDAETIGFSGRQMLLQHPAFRGLEISIPGPARCVGKPAIVGEFAV